ncbi:MAG TPA: hypothetical protein VKU00_20880 [Chthonomonadaceae bacterium]|nr:hypothetical protein [Chthonomonadaceae bacterium]
MPKLLLFMPSQKTILDQRDNAFSLISTIETVTAQINEGEMPPNAALPLSWEISTVWYQIPEDVGRTFEQRVQLIGPDGTSLVEVQATFQMGYRTQRNLGVVPGFPVGQAGEYQLRLSLREAQNDQNWTMVAEYPILVTHQQTSGTTA